MRIEKIILLLLFYGLAMSEKNVLINYTLNLSDPKNHLMEVELKLENLSNDEEFVDFQLPVWRTGRYMIFDFASGILNFNATNENSKDLNWKKISKSTWRVNKNNSSTIVVKYKIYANEFNYRTRGINSDHAFIDGTSVFMFIEKYRYNKLILKINQFENWFVTTGLNEISKNLFSADSYDILADSPLEIGNQKEINFNVENIPHTIMIFGENKIPDDTLISDFTKIVKQQKNFWGFFPYKKYIFMIHSTSSGGGGTEHLNSTIMGVRPQELSNIENYRKRFLPLVIHEFFHTWNVKYLRPKGIVPYDFMHENYLEELWISEGITSYYEEIFYTRNGFNKSENFLNNIAKQIETDRSRPGNLVQSVAESSFDAWVKFWKNTPQSFNQESDYYEKGATISFALDAELRLRTKNKISLDDLMREMIQRFPFSSSGFTNFDFQKTADDISKSNFEDFFKDFVYGVKPIEWEKYLNFYGFEIIKSDSIEKPFIGINVVESNEKTIVRSVNSNSPFYFSGLDLGDEIISINENRVKGNFSQLTENLKLNDTLKILISRSDKIKSLIVKLESKKSPNLKIVAKSNQTATEKKYFNSLISDK